jgi:hypothetical protein
MPEILIGTSGYDYPEWRGVFYPAGFACDQSDAGSTDRERPDDHLHEQA